MLERNLNQESLKHPSVTTMPDAVCICYIHDVARYEI